MARRDPLALALLAAALTLACAGPAHAQTARVRARELGVEPGIFRPGPLNAITDVAGVLVGHATVIAGDEQGYPSELKGLEVARLRNFALVSYRMPFRPPENDLQFALEDVLADKDLFRNLVQLTWPGDWFALFGDHAQRPPSQLVSSQIDRMRPR